MEQYEKNKTLAPFTFENSKRFIIKYIFWDLYIKIPLSAPVIWKENGLITYKRLFVPFRF